MRHHLFLKYFGKVVKVFTSYRMAQNIWPPLYTELVATQYRLDIVLLCVTMKYKSVALICSIDKQSSVIEM